MRRILSLLLCLLLVLGIVTPVTAQASGNDAVYIQNSTLNNAIFGDDILFENVVVDDQVVSPTLTPGPISAEIAKPVTFPTNAEPEVVADEMAVCDCASCATIAEHADSCAVKAKYHKLCAGTAESLFDNWSTFTADEQAYMLQYMKENLTGRYEDLEKLLNAPTGSASETYLDGTTVSVAGIPEDGDLIVQEADDAVRNLAEAYMEQQSDKTTELFCYDVSVQDLEGAQWQPDGKVRMELDMPGVKLHKHTRVYVVHVDDNGVASTIDAEVIADGKIAFETPGFSTFAGFTVDFEFEGVQFSIPGMTSITLTEIFDNLEIPLYVEDVTDVEFSDPSLIHVEKQEGDWLLTSLKAFFTTESLKLTMADGKVYTVTVTDAVYPTICWGNDVNEDGGYNGGEDWYLTTYRTNGSIDNSHTEDYDIRVDATYATNNTFEIVLQRNAGDTGKILYLDLHTVRVQGGANLIIRLGGTITNDNTTKVVITQVPGYRTDSSGSDFALGEMFWVEDGSVEIRPSYSDQSNVRIELDVQADSRDGAYGDSRAFVSLRKYADYFIAKQCDFLNNGTSAIICRANALSELTMTNCTFGKINSAGEVSEVCCNKSGQGGAMYIHYTVEDTETTVVDIANLTLTNVTFNGSYSGSGRGGAILCRGRIGKKFLLDGCTFNKTTSKSSHGGAIEFSNNDVGLDQGAFEMKNCVFNATVAGGARGGALRMVASSCTSFTVTDCTFIDCSAYSHGGAIAIQGAVSGVSVTNSTFTNTKALNNRGGAISINANCGPFLADNCRFSGCTSVSPGGAISMEGTVGNFTIQNDCFFTDCISSSARGGGVAVKCSVVGNVTLVDSTFRNNTAGSLGGAVHIGISSEAPAPITAGDVTVDRCEFTNNNANGVGGCLSFTDGTYNSITIQNSSFADSYSANYGGAIGLRPMRTVQLINSPSRLTVSWILSTVPLKTAEPVL